MRKLLFYAICLAGMVAVYLGVRFAVTGVSSDFGLGFVSGAVTFYVVYFAAEKFGYRAPS